MSEDQKFQFNYCGEGFSFKTLDKLQTWFKTEQDSWNWVSGINDAPNSVLNNYKQIFPPLANSFVEINRHKPRPDSNQYRNALQNLCNVLASLDRYKFILSSSEIGCFILDELKPQSPKEAVAAIGYFLNQATADNRFIPEFYAGVAKAVAYESGYIDNIKSHKSALTKLKNHWQAEFKEAFESYLNEYTEKSKQSDKLNESYQDRITELDKKEKLLDDAVKSSNKLHQDHFAKITQELENLTKKYTEYMQLKAPVDYWAKKKERSFWISFFSGLLAIGAGYLAYDVFSIYALNKWTMPLMNLKFSSVSMGLILLGLFLWGAKIFVKISLANLHLATDASEREVMIKTYLALCEDDDSELKVKNREMLLSAIFRPTNTGLIKDESPPINVIDIVNKLGKKS